MTPQEVEALIHESALVAEKHQDLLDDITGALNVPPGSDLVFCANDLREDLYEAQEEIQRLRKVESCMRGISATHHLQTTKEFLLRTDQWRDAHRSLEKAYDLYQKKGVYAEVLRELCGLEGIRVWTPVGETYSLASSEFSALEWCKEYELGPDEDSLKARRMTNSQYERVIPGSPLNLFDAAVLYADLRRKFPDQDVCGFATESDILRATWLF